LALCACYADLTLQIKECYSASSGGARVPAGGGARVPAGGGARVPACGAVGALRLAEHALCALLLV